MLSELEADVLIVGAGLSGLQAASSLDHAGFSTIVLEARSRVGGKTWSVAHEDNVGVADLGAEWLNDTTQPHIYQLAKRLGLDFNQVTVHGDAVLQGLDGGITKHPYGEQAPLPGGEHEVVKKMTNLFAEEYDKIDLTTCHECQHDGVTLEEFVLSRGGGPATLATVTVWTRVMLGCEPSELSAAYFLVYCKSQGGLMKMRSGKVQGKYVTIKTGTQSVAQGLAASLSLGMVKLNTAVKSISQTKDGVQVQSTSGQVFRGRKLIVAMATPMYAQIDFDPPLPAGKATLATSTRLGSYTKILTSYSKPWWRESGLSGASQSFIGPAAATRDTSDDPMSRFRLTSFIAGRPAEHFSQLPPAERKALILGQLASLFGSDEAQSPTEYIEQQWSCERWSQGCPSPYTPPGVLTKVGKHFIEPHGHVHFVGTETAVEWKGYMEGAVTSGIRGADEIVRLLSENAR